MLECVTKIEVISTRDAEKIDYEIESILDGDARNLTNVFLIFSLHRAAE